MTVGLRGLLGLVEIAVISGISTPDRDIVTFTMCTDAAEGCNTNRAGSGDPLLGGWRVRALALACNID